MKSRAMGVAAVLVLAAPRTEHGPVDHGPPGLSFLEGPGFGPVLELPENQARNR